MRDEILSEPFFSDAAIGARRIVTFGSDDGHVAQAAASSDALMGIAKLGASGAAGPLDVVVVGIAEVDYGGNVDAGDKLTSDADGKAVKAAPSPGNNAEIIGIAMSTGVSGDVGSVLVQPGRIQG